MFTICLSNVRFLKSILAFAHCHRHAMHSFVLSIALFHYIPYVLIFNKCRKETNQVLSLGYSQGFVVISHILFSMLENNIYSITDSKVFDVRIGVNLLLAIIE
jgi:hypothetical protein